MIYEKLINDICILIINYTLIYNTLLCTKNLSSVSNIIIIIRMRDNNNLVLTLFIQIM